MFPGYGFAGRGLLSSVTAPLIAVAVIAAVTLLGFVLKDARSAGANRVEIAHLSKALQNNGRVRRDLESVVTELHPTLESQRKREVAALSKYERQSAELRRLKREAEGMQQEVQELRDAPVVCDLGCVVPDLTGGGDDG